MGVRLIIGRAGTGKTALCAREIRTQIAQAATGGALLWIVPEQGTFSTERVLLTAGGAGFGEPPRGTFRAQVLSFRRLAMLIVRETGRGAAGPECEPPGGGEELVKPMDAVARRVLLEEMVRRERGKLTVFGSVADRPGFVERMDVTLREMRQHGHTAKSLRELVDRNAFEPAAVRRLLDVATLLEAWESEMTDAAQWDFERLMQCATEQLHAAELITGGAQGERARIWVDATSAMSGQEVRLLTELARHAAEVTVTLLADPDSPAIRPGKEAEGLAEPAGLFARTERLYRRLVDGFSRHGVAMEKPVTLRETWRFVRPALARVESAVFAEAPVEKPAEKDERPADLFSAVEKESHGSAGIEDGVELWPCGEPETEVRAVAQRIRRLAIGDGAEPGRLRFRQIAVIAADLEGYQDAVQRIFSQHGIPHFIDQKRSAAHHPVVEFLRSAVAVARSGWERDEVMLLLKTGLAGVAPEDVALVENYAIEHGIARGGWDRRWTWLEQNVDEEEVHWRVPESARVRLARANAVREKVWKGLGDFVAACGAEAAGGDGAQDGAAYVQALRALMNGMAVAERLAEWKEAATKRGELELAQFHEQIGRELERLLEILERALAGRKRTLAEFERLLSGALESLAIGLIPPTVDQVVVSSVMRSRVPEMEAVFVIGAVEGQFPKVPPEDPILSDEQREAFNRAAAEPIGEGSGRELLEMPFFDYVAMTRSRRLLVVSYPVADRQGKSLGRSRHVAQLRAVLGENVTLRAFDAEGLAAIERVCTADDLLAAFARQVRAGRGKDDAQVAAVSCWVGGGKDAAMAQARLQLQRAFGGGLPERLEAEIAARFFPRNVPLRLSVSRLERFSACPLQYFLQYTLGLSPRKEFQIDPMSRGQLVHRVLELFYRKVITEYPQWPEVDSDEVTAILRGAIAAAVRELHAEAEINTPGYEKIRDRLEWALQVQLEADRRRATVGEMRPCAVELPFDGQKMERDSRRRIVRLPVLALVTPGGVRLELNGKIDRIDQDRGLPKQMAVMDYKTGGSGGLKLDRVIEGLDLQLPTYALVLRELAEAAPVAAFFLRLGMPRYRQKAGKPPPRPPENEFYQKYKPRGPVDACLAGALDRNITPSDPDAIKGARSPWYSLAFTKKDGSPDARTDLLEHEEFTLLLDFTKWKLAALAEELTGGRVAPSPYRQGNEIPCDRCDFSTLCDFDPATGRFRALAQMNRNASLARMKQQLETQGHRRDHA